MRGQRLKNIMCDNLQYHNLVIIIQYYQFKLILLYCKFFLIRLAFDLEFGVHVR